VRGFPLTLVLALVSAHSSTTQVWVVSTTADRVISPMTFLGAGTSPATTIHEQSWRVAPAIRLVRTRFDPHGLLDTAMGFGLALIRPLAEGPAYLEGVLPGAPAVQGPGAATRTVQWAPHRERAAEVSVGVRLPREEAAMLEAPVRAVAALAAVRRRREAVDMLIALDPAAAASAAAEEPAPVEAAEAVLPAASQVLDHGRAALRTATPIPAQAAGVGALAVEAEPFTPLVAEDVEVGMDVDAEGNS